MTRSIRPLFIPLAAILISFLIIGQYSDSSTQAAAETVAVADPHPAPRIDTAASLAQAEPLTTNCRYGVAALFTGTTGPWLPTMGAGWYINFTSNKPSIEIPNHAEYVYMLRMKEGEFDPPLSEIDAKLAADPGALWLVGNEIEVQNPTTGDGTYPQDYARAYHEAYTYIKQRDPSAQVGIGGMSMATPARLQYLDIVWDSYIETYGVPMTVDVWNIHLYILSESKHFGDYQGDGRIALGTDPNIAMRAPNGAAATECPKEDVYCRAEHDSLIIFQQQIEGLRTWMKEHGQQNKPLILSEFSLLFQPEKTDEFGNNFSSDRVSAFMEDAFAYLESAKSTDIGYPADDYRLVQQWLWYSFVTSPGWSGYSSDLLKLDYKDYEVGDLNALKPPGLTFRSEVAARPVQPNLHADTIAPIVTTRSEAALTLGIRNNGTTTVEQPFTVTFYADAALTQPIGSTTINEPVNGCHWHDNTHTAVITWSNLPTGIHHFWVKVDSANAIDESDESDNVVSGIVYVNSDAPTPTPTAVPDNQPPVVTWLQPVTNGETHPVGDAATVALEVSATDDTGIQQVRFERWDSVTESWITIATDSTAPFKANVTSANLRDGYNQVTAIAWDLAGNQSNSASIWLDAGSAPPDNTPTPPPTSPPPTATPSPTPSGDQPELRIGSGRVDSGHESTIAVSLLPNGESLTTAVFGINFDQACLAFDGNDLDNNSIPDGITLSLPNGYLGAVSYDAQKVDGELELLITRQDSAAPVLPSGDLLTMTFTAVCDPPYGQPATAEIAFAAEPAVAVSNSDNQPVETQASSGALIVDGRHKAYMPAVHSSE